MLREQESLLVEWYRASQQRIRSNVSLEGWQAFCGFGFAVGMLFSYAHTVGDPAGAILLVYLALQIPVLGEEIALLARQYPLHRNLILRLLELLDASADTAEDTLSPSAAAPTLPFTRGRGLLPPKRGVGIALDTVTVHAGGDTILDSLDLGIEPGEHVAVIGASGAGKSSLAGLFLGWHHAVGGELRIDGLPLDCARLDQLRQESVWIDPSVQLWNRPLLANLTYGAEHTAPVALLETLDEVELLDLLQRLPAGLQTGLGEGGGLVSGGEGQRVRIARGLLRPQPRFVVLDEAFRGLERHRRAALLKLARTRWRDATLLCITHDIDHTDGFDRVLVLDQGRIVEQGTPSALLENPLSLYRSLLDSAAAVRDDIWSDPQWRHLRLRQGRLRPLVDTHAND